MTNKELNPESRNYYFQQYQEILKEVDAKKKKPTLFLHACCGPCLTYPLSELIRHFEVTVGFFNPNIQPKEEYEKRLKALELFLSAYAKDQGVSIPLVLHEEDFLAYEKAFADRVNDVEGGEVCLRCHAYRLGLSYHYAALHHFDYFTTVMTVSCRKPSRELNEIAKKLSLLYPETKYLYSDFKKEEGQLKGIQIAKAYHVYRQNYCGCLVSYQEAMEQRRTSSQTQSENSRTMVG